LAVEVHDAVSIDILVKGKCHFDARDNPRDILVIYQLE
jgi:hypothetical protein